MSIVLSCWIIYFKWNNVLTILLFSNDFLLDHWRYVLYTSSMHRTYFTMSCTFVRLLLINHFFALFLFVFLFLFLQILVVRVRPSFVSTHLFFQFLLLSQFAWGWLLVEMNAVVVVKGKLIVVWYKVMVLQIAILIVRHVSWFTTPTHLFYYIIRLL